MIRGRESFPEISMYQMGAGRRGRDLIRGSYDNENNNKNKNWTELAPFALCSRPSSAPGLSEGFALTAGRLSISEA